MHYGRWFWMGSFLLLLFFDVDLDEMLHHIFLNFHPSEKTNFIYLMHALHAHPIFMGPRIGTMELSGIMNSLMSLCLFTTMLEGLNPICDY